MLIITYYNYMSASKHIKKCMIEKEIKAGNLAEKLGMMPQTFYNKLSRDSMSFSDAEKIADALGCDVVLIDRTTQKIY